jgi:hypothetical protein
MLSEFEKRCYTLPPIRRSGGGDLGRRATEIGSPLRQTAQCSKTARFDRRQRLFCLQMTTHQKCQSIVWNLIELHSAKELAAPYLIREFSETERCKELNSNLPSIIQNYKSKIGEDAYMRILQYTETDEDARRAQQAAVHYHWWHLKILRQSLDFRNSLYYHIWYRSQDTFAFLGIIGTFWAGAQFVPRIVRGTNEYIRKYLSNQPKSVAHK